MKKLFALIDCNCFYVSCERVFDPTGRDRPAVVLSNNDGCAISRSPEAKAVGIAMGAPIFKCENEVRRHNVKIYSANFVLYGDMSERVMAVLSRFTPNLEVYSIDEAFLALDGFAGRDLDSYGRGMRSAVKQQTGIPVSVGISSTKTLAKIANHFAKDHQDTGGVFVLAEGEKTTAMLERTPVGEVWGIGREKAEFLNRNGIQNARQLRDAPDVWVKKHLTIMTLRTVWELRGISCLALEDASPDKKAIGISRTFGYEVRELSQMKEAVSAYMSRAAEKLRRQKSLCAFAQVFVETNPFKDAPFYRNSASTDLTPPTADSSRLVKIGLALLDKIFRDGLSYKSCGVLLTHLSPESSAQETWFKEQYTGSQRQKLMNAVDAYNRTVNSGKLILASEGLGKPWFMKQARRSKRFTTRWDELLEVRV